MTDDDAQSYCPIVHRDETPRKSARGTVLCGGCLGRLGRTLEELSTFDADADQAALDGKLARHDGAPLTGTGEKPLPVDLRKVAEREKVTVADTREVLLGWCLTIATAQHLSPPHRGRLTKLRPCGPQAACGLRKCSDRCQEPKMRPGTDVEPFTDFLLRHFDWIVSSEHVEQFAEEVFRLGSLASAILRPSGNRQFPVGECIEDVDGERCTGTMWALLTPSEENYLAASQLVCDSCDNRVDSGDWMQYGHRVKKLEAGEAA